MKRHGSLEIDEDLPLQKKSWLVERIGWASLFVIMALGAAGLFGGGPLSKRQVSSQRISLEYEYFTRNKSPFALNLTIKRDPNEGEHAAVWVSMDYLKEVEIVGVMPEPEKVEARQDRHVHFLRWAPDATEMKVLVTAEKDAGGKIGGRIGIGSDSVEISQVVYP